MTDHLQLAADIAEAEAVRAYEYKRRFRDAVRDLQEISRTLGEPLEHLNDYRTVIVTKRHVRVKRFHQGLADTPLLWVLTVTSALAVFFSLATVSDHGWTWGEWAGLALGLASPVSALWLWRLRRVLSDLLLARIFPTYVFDSWPQACGCMEAALGYTSRQLERRARDLQIESS